MRKLDLRLFRLIKSSKGQFISILTVIALALAIYVSSSMTAINLEDSVEEYYRETNLADLTIMAINIPNEVLIDIGNIDGVKEVQGRIVEDFPLLVEDGDERVNVRIISIPQYNRINKLYMQSGREVKANSQEAIVIQQFANARGIELGDKITPLIYGVPHQLEVVGVGSSSEYSYLVEKEETLLPAGKDFGVIYVNETIVRNILNYYDGFNQLLIKVEDDSIIENIVKAVESYMGDHGLISILKQNEVISVRLLNEEVQQMKNLSLAVPILFLMVASIIIIIMLSRVVRNDRTSIGVLKALGYRNSSILLHYTKYTLSIGLLGGTLGAILGILISDILTNLYAQFINIPMFKTEVYYVYVIYGIVLSCIFTGGAGLSGSKYVLKIAPADSMRPEAPKAGGKILIESITWLWRSLSFSNKMVVRNTLRNKKRFLFTVLSIALTYGITMTPFQMGNSIEKMFSNQYGIYHSMDYNISFNSPMPNNVITELGSLTTAHHIEPKIEVPLQVQTKEDSKAVSIIGIPMNTQMFEFYNKRNQAIDLPKEGILLTEGLSKELNIKEGDFISIRSYIPGTEAYKVEVKGIVKQYLGSNGYMNIEYMEELLSLQGYITGVYMNSNNDPWSTLRDYQYIRSVVATKDLVGAFEEYLDLMVYMIGILILFAGILGFAIVYNSTVISLEERKLEFSSLRVLGFHKNEIHRLVTKENILMTGLGIIIGIPIAVAMAHGISNTISTEIYVIPVILSIRDFLRAALAVSVFVLIAQLATARKISKINFIETLKSRI